MSQPEQPNKRPTNVRWRILGLLVVASFISYMLRYNVSTASVTMMADLQITEQQLGYILAAFTLGYTIFQFPGGVFSDVVGPRRALSACMLLWAVLTVVTSIVPGTTSASTTTIVFSLVVIRFLVGAVHAPIYPVTGGVVERWFPVGSWALPNGLSSTGLTLGTAATAPLMAWLLGQYGWRISFAVLAPLGVIGAALWYWYARDSATGHPATNEAEVALIAANRPTVSEAPTASPSWLRILKDRNVLLLTLAYACMNYVFYQMFNWVYYYHVTVRGIDEQVAGWFTSVQWIAAAIGATLGGLVCDALCRRYGIRLGCRLPGVVAVAISGVLFAIGALSANAYVVVACLSASFLFNQMTEGAFWAAGISIGGRHAAISCGVMNTGGNAIGFVNALLVPFVAGTLGWTAAMVSASIFAVVSALLWLLIRADATVAD